MNSKENILFFGSKKYQGDGYYIVKKSGVTDATIYHVSTNEGSSIFVRCPFFASVQNLILK